MTLKDRFPAIIEYLFHGGLVYVRITQTNGKGEEFAEWILKDKNPEQLQKEELEKLRKGM